MNTGPGTTYWVIANNRHSMLGIILPTGLSVPVDM